MFKLCCMNVEHAGLLQMKIIYTKVTNAERKQ